MAARITRTLSRLRNLTSAILKDRIIDPYKPPQDFADAPRVESWQPIRICALLFLIGPVVLAVPIRHWVFNVAGNRLVSPLLQPQDRAHQLNLAYIAILLSISVLFLFSGSALLWRARFISRLSGAASILFGLLSIPSTIFLVYTIWYMLNSELAG